MNSIFDCCFPKQEGDFVINDKKENSSSFVKANEGGALFNNRLESNDKAVDKQRINFPFPPIESTNRNEYNKKEEKSSTKGKILFSLDNENEQKEDKEVNNYSHQHSNFDKQSELSHSHYSMQSEQSTEIFINRTITPEDVVNGPKLVIKEIEGNQLEEEKEIQINPSGMIGGARKANDGVVLLGPNLTDQYGKCINDLVIGSNLKDIGNHVCVIYYRKEQKKYFIRTFKDQLSNGLSVLLVKIKDNYSIKRTELLMIGDLFFVLKSENNELKVTKLSCKRSPEEMNHSYSIIQSPLTIGRDKGCEMSFSSNKAFSKIHCTFYYDQVKKEWVIQDGMDNKPSTNGIWIIPKHSLEIFDKMTFKIMGCSKFFIDIITK